MLKKKLQSGFNVDIIQQAASLYDGAPVIEASDEARALRYISFIFFTVFWIAWSYNGISRFKNLNRVKREYYFHHVLD